jgi:serine/threonine protein kinase
MIEADVSSESAWFATEYVEGLNLKQYVEANGPLNSENWIKLAQGLLSAFETIHKQNVIHRDIKPSNILLGKTGAKIIDFGIALTEEATSLTTTGLVAGSPAWLSPEQINDNSITSFSDIFSLGSVLTFAATGLSPWNKDSSTKTSVIFHKILTEEPNLTGLTDFQKEIVSKLLEKDPKKRPSAKEAKKLFESKIGHDLTLISPKMDLTQTEIFKPTIQTKAKKPGKKPIFISAIAASVLLISSIFFINNSNQQADNLTLSESLPIDTASEPQPEAISSTPALSSTPVQTPIPEASAEVEVVPTEEPTPETTQEATPKASPVAEESEPEVKASPKSETHKGAVEICRKGFTFKENGDSQYLYGCWSTSGAQNIGLCVIPGIDYQVRAEAFRSGELIETYNFSIRRIEWELLNSYSKECWERRDYGRLYKGYQDLGFFPNRFDLAQTADFVNYTITGHAYPNAFTDYFKRPNMKPFWCNKTYNNEPTNPCKQSLL